MKQYKFGFTLVELLVAMAIFAILFTIMSSIAVSMNRSSQVLNSKSQLIQEAQTVQRLVAGRISEAIYVFPAGTTMQLGSGITTQNTARSGAGSSWTVNTDPFIAMVLPPEAPTYNPGSNVPNNCIAATTAGGTSVTDGCYRFYAYYAVKRADLVNAVKSSANPGGLELSSVPPKDTNNEGAWVLMQYKSNLFGWNPGYTGPSQGITAAKITELNSLYPGRPGVVLADYIQPQTTSNDANDLFPTATTTNAAAVNCMVFCVTATPATTPTRSNNGTVDVRFRMQQNSKGLSKPVVISGTAPNAPANSYIGGVVSPRNWWPQP